MRHYLIYAGKQTTDFDVWISGTGTFDAPKRDVTMIDVPGRSGKLTRDNGRFDNIEVTYPAFISRNFIQNMEGFRAFMKSLTGYQRLEDTYHPDYYRQAVLIDNFNPKTTPLNRGGEFNIVFNCKPQRFLKLGEKTMQFRQNGTIHNPTYYEAKPIIRAYGTGQFTVGGETIKINETSDYIDFDCDLQDAYRGLTNMNGKIELLTGGFPTLPPGDSGVVLNGIYILEIIARYWTI